MIGYYSASELTTLPGVGPKVAHLVMSVSYNIESGVVVDTHMHRFSARVGWTNPNRARTVNNSNKHAYACTVA